MRLLLDLRPLRSSPAFRRLWVGTTLSTAGAQLAVVAVLHEVWELTGSPVAVGAIGIAHAVPMIVFGLVGGTLADAVDRRRLVGASTVAQLLVAGSLTAQAVADIGSVALLLALVSVQTAAGALGAPARRTFVARLLPADQVGAGIALTSFGFQLAMLVGPAVAGLVIARWGVAACFAADGVMFLAALYGVVRLPAMHADGAGERPGPRALRAGWRFVTGRPALRGVLLADLVATVLAMPVALFPMINERFGGRPETLGLFLSAIAVGGLVAGLGSGPVTRSTRPGAVMLAAAATWGVALAGFGAAPALWLALGCLAVAGAADTASVVSRGAIVQLATPDGYRGRASSVEHVVGVAGPDLGNARAGLVAGATSAEFAAIAGGLLCAVGIGVLAVTNAELRRFSAAVDEPADASPTAGTATPAGPGRAGRDGAAVSPATGRGGSGGTRPAGRRRPR